MTDYRKALDTLRNGKVRFIVIGGVAGTAHGSIDEIAVDRDS